MPSMATRLGRACGLHLVLVWAVAVAGSPAAAQTRDEPYSFARGRVTFGGEVAGMLAPEDNEAFFNYTDY